MKKESLKRSFFKKHSRVGTWLLALLLFLATLILIELGLRMAGFQPGILVNNSNIRRVDSLILRDEFANDDRGIMRTSKERIQLVKKLSLPGMDVPAYAEKYPEGFGDYIGNLLLEYYDERNKPPATDFSRLVENLKSKPEDQRTQEEAAIINYSYSPINSNGYRSIEFKNYKTDKKKVLLLGDSFAWGMSAKPITNSFADLLLAKDYIVFNTGIPGVDLPQYCAIATECIPLLQPDFVIVNFFMGNDEVFFKRQVDKLKPIYYDTNAGLLFSSPFGCFLEMKEVYDLYIKTITIPHQVEVPGNSICAKTAFTTLLWKVMSRWKEADINSLKECDAHRYDPPVSEEYVDQIQKLCNEYNSKMRLVLIPERNQKIWEQAGFNNFKAKADLNFQHTAYYYPAQLTDSDFHDDGHFNNAGMKKYANFLEALMDSIAGAK